MATMRDSIMQALVARLVAGLPGWTVQLRGTMNAGRPPMAACYYVGESKQHRGNDSYACTMAAMIEIIGAVEDADEDLDADPVTGEANPYRYLDRLVADVERLIGSPDVWGVEPDFTDVAIDGHDVAEAEEEEPSYVSALLRLTFTYRHSLADPGT